MKARLRWLCQIASMKSRGRVQGDGSQPRSRAALHHQLQTSAALPGQGLRRRADKLSRRLIEEHLTLITGYRTQYTNLPDSGSAQLETLLKKPDQPANPKQSSTTP